MTWRQYIQGLKPTKSGILGVSLCLVIIPLCTDLFLLIGQDPKDPVSMSLPLINSYIKMLPLYILYLVSYFFVLKTWNFIIKKLKIEKLYFGS